jgi:hypothetical protein
MFEDIFMLGNGAAIYVAYTSSVMTLRADAFANVSAGTLADNYAGACVFMRGAGVGTSAVDCCMTECEAQSGSFLFIESVADALVSGLNSFDCATRYGGTVYENLVSRMRLSECNFTSQKADKVAGVATGIYQSGTSSSTTANFTLFQNCAGPSVFYEASGNGASFLQCIWAACDYAFEHGILGVAVDTCVECYFDGTRVRGNSFYHSGMILLVDCLFSADYSSTVGVATTGLVFTFTSTAIEFDTASLLPTCGGLPWTTPVATLSPLESATLLASATRSPMATVSAEPYPTPSVTLKANDEPKMSKAMVGGIVAAAVVAVISAVVVGVVIIHRRSAGSHDGLMDSLVSADGARWVGARAV